jgi:hypothetical protein
MTFSARSSERSSPYIFAARVLSASPLTYCMRRVDMVRDAILDRIIHNAYRIELKGESMRKLRVANTEPPKPAKEAPQNVIASASTPVKARRK